MNDSHGHKKKKKEVKSQRLVGICFKTKNVKFLDFVLGHNAFDYKWTSNINVPGWLEPQLWLGVEKKSFNIKENYYTMTYTTVIIDLSSPFQV